MASEEVRLPQLGESVTEGIIIGWLVKEGDHVDEDQPLFELSTDKVDTEVPSPVAGTVTEIRVDVDDTVEVGQVVAVIDSDGQATGTTTGQQEDRSPAAESRADAAAADTDATPDTSTATGAAAATTAPRQPDAVPPEADRSSTGPRPSTTPAGVAPLPGADGGRAADGPGGAALVSPIVRRMMREHGLSTADVEGTGKGGRITRDDVQTAIRTGTAGQARSTDAAPRAPAGREVSFEGREHTESLTRVRTVIAQHMMESLRSTAQLTTAVEVDMTRIMNLRERAKDAFKQREGASLSPLPIIARAVCMTVPRHPVVNGSIDVEAGTATYHAYVNLGIAVDTPYGLLVPNIKDAQDLTIPALARSITDLAARAREKKLQPDEIAGGTFTITNTGSRGALWDTPILNPPEVAILGASLIEKRPVVVSSELGDQIAVRHMTYLVLTYDHRMVDGADAARFLTDLKRVLETHDFTEEVGG